MMTNKIVNSPSELTFISEIVTLDLTNDYLSCFRLNHDIERKLGNLFGWRFSNKFPGVVVIFEERHFWILAKDKESMRDSKDWKHALLEIQEALREDIGDQYYSIHWIEKFNVTPLVKAQLAVRVMKLFCRFSNPAIFPKKEQIQDHQVQVRREVNFWAEIIDLSNQIKPAITLTIDSSIVYSSDLEQFYKNHPYRQDPEKLLVGLKVKDIEKNSYATIVKLAGTIGERKDELLRKATGSISKRKLEEPDDLNQPVVAVKFSKNSKEYIYLLAALRPCVTAETDQRFDVQYGELLKHTKISYSERQELLKLYKKEAQNTLINFGFKLEEKNINSMKYSELFWVPDISLEQTPILFGNSVKGEKGAILKGLSQGGVYYRHPDYADPSRKIRLAILKPSDFKFSNFRKQLQEKLKKYKFETILPEENRINFSLEGLSEVEKRARVEEAVDQLIRLDIPVDIALVFLPQDDRNADNTEEGSLYSWIKQKFLRRGIMNQMIYENTLRDSTNYNNILNQVAPGILGKLGNLPFVLAESLNIADYFIGLDVSRSPKKKLAGSLNVCASVRLYGGRGEFVRYRVEDSLTEGEEIHQRILENFLPQSDLKNKTVLIYRDGKFRGNEVNHLLARAKAIKSKFILVECYKTGIPRLYNFSQKQITQPSKGLAFSLSSREVIIVTTQVHEKVGVPRPLRLRIHELGEQVCLKKLVNATLKLTLLHYGSLKDPRLPIPLHGADTIAYRRLQGICPSLLEDDRQFWL